MLSLPFQVRLPFHQTKAGKISAVAPCSAVSAASSAFLVSVPVLSAMVLSASIYVPAYAASVPTGFSDMQQYRRCQ